MRLHRIESQPNWAVGEDEEEGEKRGEGVEEDKEGEEEEGSTSGEAGRCLREEGSQEGG